MATKYSFTVHPSKVIEWALDEKEKYTAPKAKRAQGVFIWDDRQPGGEKAGEIARLFGDSKPVKTLRPWPLLSIPGEDARICLAPHPEEGRKVEGTLFKFMEADAGGAEALAALDGVYPADKFIRLCVGVTEDDRAWDYAWCYFSTDFAKSGLLLEKYP